MPLQNQKGLTLIEVLLSIVILIIFLVSVMNFFPQMGQMNKSNEDKQQAVNLAKQELNTWQGLLSTIDFENFELEMANFTNEFIKIKENTDSVIIENQNTFVKSDFQVEIIVYKHSDLPVGSTKAFLIHLALLSNTTQSPVTETYGYIFYKG